ncbi:DUF952 domain-containing protein [Nocardia sp. CDC159]|uniref:DUF952 domain-containing protein n=1 Tax=Nocardia pulmonis TaxID=2951408 RepID=A0A9X2E4V9_9NOCA|nr:MULTISPECIES: DUF952 domain-containing protein [Nocardia]MCM6774342.1 DUF952 domain-containing protein [Nocardia pulmonis]MCM6787592.1 DUF952 domain-containing protein [Nocardia sp. CDC159]
MITPDSRIAKARTLVHMCTRDEWEAARHTGERRAPSMETEGFIHLSAPGQVHLPANRLFAGSEDLVLLWLDPDRLGAPVVWEPGVPTDPAAMLFPHLYGPIPLVAVVGVTDYRPGPDGRFPEISDD